MANLKVLALVLFGVLIASTSAQFASLYSNNFANQAAAAQSVGSTTAYNSAFGYPGYGYGGLWGGYPGCGYGGGLWGGPWGGCGW